MKTAIRMILAVSLTLSSVGHAQLLERTPESTLALFDEYVTEVKKETGKLPEWFEYARQKQLAAGPLAQVVALKPDQFNAFLFLMMNRYVAQPEERPYIFNFLTAVTEIIASDLEYTRKLQAGPEALVIDGALMYGSMALVALHVLYGVGLKRNIFGMADLMKQIRHRQVAIAQSSKLHGLVYRFRTSPTTWISAASTPIGAGIGLLEHMVRSSATHRFNPAVAMMVLQAQIACQISYQGLAVQDEYEQLKGDIAKLKTAKANLVERIVSIAQQSDVLKKQYSRLTNLDVRDRLFQNALAQYPKSENWQQYRASLSEAETSENGLCRQVSLEFLKENMEKTLTGILEQVPDEDAQPTPETAPPIPETR